MGWLWGPSVPHIDSPPSSTVGNGIEQVAPTPIPKDSSANIPKSRDEQADAELVAFLRSIGAESTPPSSTHAFTSPQAASDSSAYLATSDDAASQPPTSDTLDISPHALRPRTMRCRDAFDAAHACGNMGGRFRSVYRYGEIQPCNEHWNTFWFCMRNRTTSEPARGEAIAEYIRDREERVRQRMSGGKSSEDVWDMRTVPLEENTAFKEKPDFGKGDWNL